MRSMKRILVVLPNWFGETLFATPFLRALRSQCPEASITTLGWPACREVLLHNPHVSALLDYEERGAHAGCRGKWRLIRALRAQRFDTAFILRPSLSRSLLLALAGIPVRVGFDQPKSGWLLTHRAPRPAWPTHKALSYLPALNAVGLLASASPYEYTVAPDEREWARRFLTDTYRVLPAQDHAPGAAHRPLAILHPGANWPHKRWAPERFAALGDRLVAHQEAHVVISGGPDDLGLAQTVARQMRRRAVVAAGSTTLRQLGACLSLAQLVVSNDTAISHLAAALRTPLVALYGPTSPALTGPLGDPRRVVVLHHGDSCPHIPCYAPDRPAHPGMDAITVDEAYEASTRMMDAGRRICGTPTETRHE